MAFKLFRVLDAKTAKPNEIFLAAVVTILFLLPSNSYRNYEASFMEKNYGSMPPSRQERYFSAC